MQNKFVNVRMRREIVEGMIGTYEFLLWDNSGCDKVSIRKIIKILKKSLE